MQSGILFKCVSLFMYTVSIIYLCVCIIYLSDHFPVISVIHVQYDFHLQWIIGELDGVNFSKCCILLEPKFFERASHVPVSIHGPVDELQSVHTGNSWFKYQKTSMCSNIWHQIKQCCSLPFKYRFIFANLFSVFKMVNT